MNDSSSSSEPVETDAPAQPPGVGSWYLPCPDCGAGGRWALNEPEQCTRVSTCVWWYGAYRNEPV